MRFSYPGDRFNRYWQPYNGGSIQVAESQATVETEAFWNKPPQDVFRRGLTAGPGKSLELQWPPTPLPAATYYLALYFQDSRADGWRVFDVAVNGNPFFVGLNVSTEGSMLYAAGLPLSGQTTITLTPAAGSPVGPVINAAELMMVVPLGGRTHPRDGNLIISLLVDLAIDPSFARKKLKKKKCCRSYRNASSGEGICEPAVGLERRSLLARGELVDRCHLQSRSACKSNRAVS